jgi:hypothetical protein
MESGLAERLGLLREMPRYRYFRMKRAKGKSERTFEWTTEKSLGEGGKPPVRYWAIERRWVRTRRGQTGKIIRSVGFATRKKAKERALQWYEKARTPAVTAG